MGQAPRLITLLDIRKRIVMFSPLHLSPICFIQMIRIYWGQGKMFNDRGKQEHERFGRATIIGWNHVMSQDKF
jgi:hypothetical protein